MGGQTGIWRRSCLFQFPSCLPPPQVASPGCGRKFRQLHTSSRVCLGYQPQVIRRAVDLLVTSHGPWAGASALRPLWRCSRPDWSSFFSALLWWLLPKLSSWLGAKAQFLGCCAGVQPHLPPCRWLCTVTSSSCSDLKFLGPCPGKPSTRGNHSLPVHPHTHVPWGVPQPSRLVYNTSMCTCSGIHTCSQTQPAVRYSTHMHTHAHTGLPSPAGGSGTLILITCSSSPSPPWPRLPLPGQEALPPASLLQLERRQQTEFILLNR